MKKTSLRLAFDDFDESLVFYADLAQRIVSARRVIRHKYEKLELLEAFILRLVTLWDVFVGELMVACLNRDTSRYAEHRGLKLRKHLSADECTAMLTGLGYLDFRSAGDLQRTAKEILAINPFVDIPKGSRQKVDELLIMRNYLSHYSGRSRRALDAVYRRTYGMKTFREPGAFLWANSSRKGQIRFGVYIDSLADASKAMRASLGELAR